MGKKRKKLIANLKVIVREIEECDNWYFFICNRSKVPNVCKNEVVLLKGWAEEYLSGFNCLEAFGYKINDDSLPRLYNRNKIDHINQFIAYLEDGGDYKKYL